MRVLEAATAASGLRKSGSRRPHARALTALCLAVLMIGCAKGKATINVDDEKRCYLLTVPASYTGAAPVPLLLALHQFSDTASGMRSLTDFDAMAEREGFIVCYPQGKWRVWNAGQGNGGDDVAFITALVDKLAGDFNIDRDRVYATGISAGGQLAQYLACQTDILAAIATVAGTPVKSVLDSCTRDTPIPVLTIHGEEDSIVPYAGGAVTTGAGEMSFVSAAEDAAAWARINGCDATPVSEVLPPLVVEDSSRVTRNSYTCPTGAPVLFYSVGGAGHTWPGHDNWYPAFIVGGTSKQLDASETIWAFLSAQRRPAQD